MKRLSASPYPLLALAALFWSGNTLAYVALQTTTATNALPLNSFIPIASIARAFTGIFLAMRRGFT